MCVPHVEQKCLVSLSELWYGVVVDKSGLTAEEPWVISMYEVRREPEMRREVLQLQRWEGRGSLVMGMLNVWVVELHEHATISSREAGMLVIQLMLDGLRPDMGVEDIKGRDCLCIVLANQTAVRGYEINLQAHPALPSQAESTYVIRYNSGS